MHHGGGPKPVALNADTRELNGAAYHGHGTRVTVSSTASSAVWSPIAGARPWAAE